MTELMFKQSNLIENGDRAELICEILELRRELNLRYRQIGQLQKANRQYKEKIKWISG